MPWNGQHSEDQQQQPSNDPRSIGTRQSRDYRPNLNPYHGNRRPGFALPHRKQVFTSNEIHHMHSGSTPGTFFLHSLEKENKDKSCGFHLHSCHCKPNYYHNQTSVQGTTYGSCGCSKQLILCFYIIWTKTHLKCRHKCETFRNL